MIARNRETRVWNLSTNLSEHGRTVHEWQQNAFSNQGTYACWKGQWEYGQDDYVARFHLIVHFGNVVPHKNSEQHVREAEGEEGMCHRCPRPVPATHGSCGGGGRQGNGANPRVTHHRTREDQREHEHMLRICTYCDRKAWRAYVGQKHDACDVCPSPYMINIS